MNNIIDSGIQKRQHTCHVCGKTAAWDENWSWWGSIATEDHGDILKVCSDKCAQSVKDPEELFETVFGRRASSTHYRRC